MKNTVLFFFLLIFSVPEIHASSVCMMVNGVAFEAEFTHTGQGIFSIQGEMPELIAGSGITYSVSGSFNKVALQLDLHMETNAFPALTYNAGGGITFFKYTDFKSNAKLGQIIYCRYYNSGGESGQTAVVYDWESCENNMLPVMLKYSPDEDTAEFKLKVINNNPQNISVTYSAPSSSPLSVRILDEQGNQVRMLQDKEVTQGNHYADWNGRKDDGTYSYDMIYIAELNVNGRIVRKKFII